MASLLLMVIRKEMYTCRMVAEMVWNNPVLIIQSQFQLNYIEYVEVEHRNVLI